jgi:predicted metal-dependent phosphotriesterase family hydrolase
MDEFAKAITTVGAENCIIATDLGQAPNPVPVVGMTAFIKQLVGKGITQQQIDLMVKKNPARLLGL